ncbi:hypothetical protein [Embleya sp. NPDC020886]|uniref:hypothetical protein n=1 Tax=Embleya sp. NPDC020886 TaxID=3363980 RepID=UPI0037BB89BD
MMEIQEYPVEGRLPIRVGSRVRHVDEHAELPEGTVVALPAASERVAVVQPLQVGRSPYLCPIGHLVVLDLDDELAAVARGLWRVDAFGCAVGRPIAVPIACGGGAVRGAM